MTAARAAWVGAALAYGFVAVLAWTMFTVTTPDSQRLTDIVGLTLLLGTPLAAACAVLGHGLAGAARGRDLAERILGVAFAGATGRPAEWGAAMRAELASIEDPRARRRFAWGGAVASIRSRNGRGIWLTALATGAGVAVITLVQSRAALSSGRGGILGSLGVATILLFVVSLAVAASRRSFRAGLLTGAVSLVAAVVGAIGMAMWEATRWYQLGVFIMDGDPPKGGQLDMLTAVLDPLGFLLPIVLFWAPWPVLGAAAGARLIRARRPAAGPVPAGR